MILSLFLVLAPFTVGGSLSLVGVPGNRSSPEIESLKNIPPGFIKKSKMEEKSLMDDLNDMESLFIMLLDSLDTSLRDESPYILRIK